MPLAAVLSVKLVPVALPITVYGPPDVSARFDIPVVLEGVDGPGAAEGC